MDTARRCFLGEPVTPSAPHNRLDHLLLSELKSTNLSLKQLDSVKKGGCYSGLHFYVKKINQIPFDAVNNVTL